MKTAVHVSVSLFFELCNCRTRRPWEWYAQQMKALDQARRFDTWFAMVNLHSDVSRFILGLEFVGLHAP